MLVDVLLGLLILALLAVLLTSTVSRQNASIRKLSNSRIAADMAEAALIALQSGAKPAEADQSPAPTIERLPDASPVPGCTWVRVTATFEGARGDLVGLVRDDDLAAIEPRKGESP